MRNVGYILWERWEIHCGSDGRYIVRNMRDTLCEI